MFDFFAQDFFSRFQISAPASTYEKQENLQISVLLCSAMFASLQTFDLSCQIFQTEEWKFHEIDQKNWNSVFQFFSSNLKAY
mgnify:CR=1 FL=1